MGNRAVTREFTLDDMPGAAGRMDVLCRAVNSAFFLSHDLRRDVVVYLVLLGPPTPPKTLKLEGLKLKYMNPDERNIGGLIRKALAVECKSTQWRESTPGIEVASIGTEELANSLGDVLYLHEEGTPIEEIELPEKPVFLLGDDKGLTTEQESIDALGPRASLGPVRYHTDHCITIVNRELDLRGF